jgi:large subunit ribosomal protein L6
VKIQGSAVEVKGPKGTLSHTFVGVLVRQDGEKLVLEPKGEGQQFNALWGLGRSLLNNMVTGVSAGFVKELQVVGTGYRVEQKGPGVALSVGFSKPKDYVPPTGVKVVVKDQSNLVVEGIDKQLVGQVAAEIRSIRKPEPYKGKGVRYKDEVVRQKAGKTGK